MDAVADIVLTTLNAKYIHTAFGLRCLRANLGPLRSRAAIAEFDLHQRPLDVAEAILRHQPRIVGLGVYIWNITAATELAAVLKRLRPDLILILGGPEVSFETEQQPITRFADHVITGEADLVFREVCESRLAGGSPPRIVTAQPPALADVALPYGEYSTEDIAHRILYVEASRGCPFECDFCLSSLDVPVRQFPLEPFLAAMRELLDRGATHLKFVDRTFNLHLPTARTILEFLLARHRPGMLFHFEIVPDRLPDSLREIIARFPPGALQFEAGIQTFNPEVAARIHRRQDPERTGETLRFLRYQTGVHVHADLVFGLPGESLESFATGFDRLVTLAPQEIQVGILKKLRGAPIARHDAEWEMVYNPNPPYEILRNRLLDFTLTQHMRRFARYWDLVANSGNFLETTTWLWKGAPSPFQAFLEWSDWLHEQARRTDSIALPRLTQFLFEWLTAKRGHPAAEIAPVMARDHMRPGRKDVPPFLLNHLPEDLRFMRVKQPVKSAQTRQARHLSGNAQP